MPRSGGLHGNVRLEGCAQLRAGTTLCGRYTIDHLIGVGGMATVYAGRHRNGNPVAIKVLHDRLALDADFEAGFRREAQLVNGIRHPGVVHIQDDDVSIDGRVFLVMPLLEGETLYARTMQLGGRLPTLEAAQIGCAILEVLQVAHDAGVIHCDIKPENIFLTTDGEVKVLDFGIARFFSAVGSPWATRTSVRAGTPSFMAPEQAQGRFSELDARVDIWATGATLFTAISGRLVHEGTTPELIAAQAALERARPLAAVAPQVPRELGGVIDRALAFDRSERWPTAASMRQALLQACNRQHDVAPSTSTAPEEQPIPQHGAEIQECHADSSGTSLGSTAVDAPGPTLPYSEHRAWTTLRPQLSVAALAICCLIAGALVARTTLTAIPVGKASSLEAGIALDAALQLWKDASSQAARDKFAEAARLDPGLAVAHVFFAAAAQYIDPSSRTHLAQARALRAHLTPSQASLLHALEPLEAEPPDIAEATRRFDIHLEQFPGEWTSWAARGVHDLRTKQPARVMTSIQHMSGALPLWLKGRAELLQGNTESARAVLEDCARQFPQAIDCLSFLARLEANEGRCEISASIARQLIAESPQSPEGFDALARAELGRTHDTRIALAALEEKWTRVAPDRKEVDEARDRYFLEVHDGHMGPALVAADRWEKAAAKASVYAFARAFPIISRLALELELGDGDAAARSAQALAYRSSSWLRSDFFDVSVEITRALYLTGQLDREHLRVRQAQEEQDLLARGGYFDSEVRWLEVYAQSVQDREDAENALEHRPPADHDLDPAFRDPSVDLRVGRTLFLAGRLEDSLELLRRARGACTLYRALEQVQAATLYGKALAAAGRTQEACAEFESVLKRWGEEPRSRSVQAALAEGHHLGCTVRSMKRKGKT